MNEETEINLEKLVEIDMMLDLYVDIPGLINIHTSEIGTLSRLIESITNESVKNDIAKRIQELHENINSLLDTRRKVEGWFPYLPKNQRLILRLKYFEGENWQAVAIKAGLSIRQCQNHKNEALKTILKRNEVLN